jgi:predicted RNase H-like HicB family nuclease
MNKSRRSRIDEIIQKIEDLTYDIDVLRDEEEESYENLPESIQYSDRGETMSEAIDNLESAISSLEEATEYLNEAKGE